MSIKKLFKTASSSIIVLLCAHSLIFSVIAIITYIINLNEKAIIAVLPMSIAIIPVVFNLSHREQKKLSAFKISHEAYLGLCLIALCAGPAFIAGNLLQYNPALNAMNVFQILFLFGLLPLVHILLTKEKNLRKQLTQQLSEEKLVLAKMNEKNVKPKEEEQITLKSIKTMGRLIFHPSQLVKIEACGNYCKFFFIRDEKLINTILHIPMKEIENNFRPYSQFVRCHKSTIINIKKVESFSGNSRGYNANFGFGLDPVKISRNYQKSFDAYKKSKDFIVIEPEAEMIDAECAI